MLDEQAIDILARELRNPVADTFEDLESIRGVDEVLGGLRDLS